MAQGYWAVSGGGGLSTAEATEVQDLLAQDLGAMTWAALQASSYANGSVGLAALESYSSVFITDWGVRMFPDSGKTYWTCPHPIVIAKHGTSSGSDVVYAANGTTASAVASASAGAKTRVTITGHGLTAANDGVNVYVTAGTNWTVGFYVMTYVDADNIDLTVTWNASFGNPTVRSVTPTIQTTILKTVNIPAKLMQINSEIAIESAWQMSGNTNAKYHYIQHNTTDIWVATFNGASNTAVFDRRIIRNRGAKNSQLGAKVDGNHYTTGTSAPVSGSVDTDAASTINFGAKPGTVNDFIRIAGYMVEVRV